MMAHRTVRLLHLSDIHFGVEHCFDALPGSPPPIALSRDLLSTLASHITKREEKPDVLIVSGDLTSSGVRSEFEQASGFVSGLMTQLGIPKGHLVIVPGNHDVQWGRDKCLGSSAEFDSFISRTFQEPVADLSIRSLHVGGVYIMGLDLTRLETPSRRGVGYAGHDQLDKANEILNRDCKDVAIKILVVHYHLLPVAWREDLPENHPPSFTLDSQTVIAWAQEHGFAGILHGHQHQAFLSTFHLSDRP